MLTCLPFPHSHSADMSPRSCQSKLWYFKSQQLDIKSCVRWFHLVGFFFWGGEWLCFFSSYYSDLMFKNIFVSSVDITPKPQLGNEIQPPRFLPSSVPWPPFPSSFVIALIFFFPLKTGSVCVNSFSLDGRQHPAGFCPGPPRSGPGRPSAAAVV